MHVNKDSSDSIFLSSLFSYWNVICTDIETTERYQLLRKSTCQILTRNRLFHSAHHSAVQHYNPDPRLAVLSSILQFYRSTTSSMQYMTKKS